MQQVLKIILALAMVFIVVKDVNQYITYKLNIQLYELMAKKYDCVFLTTSASKADVGMFDCQKQIVFKKLESN